MMKRIILLFSFLSVFLTDTKAQAPSDNACDANLFCSTTSLDNYSGKIELPTKPKYLFPKGFCGGSVDGPTWFRFIAESATLQLRFNYSGCGSVGQTGFQAAIFSTTNCKDSASYNLVSNCLNLGSSQTNGTLTATGLVNGQTYYIFIDGLSGSACDYNIDVLGGTTIKTVSTGDLTAPSVIYGPTEICNLSASAVFSLPRNPNATNYNITVEINGGAPIGGLQKDTFLKVNAAFTPVGIARVTANYVNNCSAGPTKTLDVIIGNTTTIQMAPINLNFGQSVSLADTVFAYGPTPLAATSIEDLIFAREDLSGLGGCDTIYKVTITRFAQALSGRVYFLRPGETITLGGTTYNVTAGVCTPIITPANDTIYNATQTYNITPATPALNCASVTLRLNQNLADSCANTRHFKTNTWYYQENGLLTSLGSGNNQTLNSITFDSIVVIIKDSVIVNGKPASGYKVYFDTLRTALTGFGAADVPPISTLINGLNTTTVCQGSTVTYKLGFKTPLATTYTWSLLRGGGNFTTAQGDTTITVKWGSTTTRDTLRVISSNACKSGPSRDLIVNISTFPNLNAGVDDTICGLTTTLKGISGGNLGNWSSVVGNPSVPGFQNSTIANTSVTVTATGVYRFSWTETNGACNLSDTVSITFNAVPQIVNASLRDSCNAIRTQAFVRFSVSGGTPPYSVYLGGTNTLVGTITTNGGQFQSAGFTPGAYSYEIRDAKKCSPPIISGTQACANCNTNAGVMQAGALVVCEGDTARANYLAGAVLEPDDTLQFVIHTGDPKTGIVARSYTPRFTFQTGMSYGVTYFISAIAGNKISNAVDINDGCFNATGARLLSVIFNKRPTATMSVLDSNLCQGSCATARFTITGQLPYTLVTRVGTPAKDSIINTPNTTYDYVYCPNVNTALRFVSIKDATGCIDSVKVNKTVNFSLFAPVNAGKDTLLTVCEGIDTTINLGNLLRGAVAGGTWTETSATRSSGTAFNPATPSFRTRNQTNGVYRFSYLVRPAIINSPCPADTAVISIRIQTTPKADAGPDDIITCARPVVIIGGNTPISSGVTIQWSSRRGNLGGNAPQQEVSQADTYTITASSGGCSSRDDVVITADTISPRALITPVTDSITCLRDTLTLSGTRSSPAGIVYLWSYNGSPYDNNPTTLARYGGTYMLTVAKLTNGCVGIDSLVVKENRVLPTVIIEPSAKLNCKDTIITLNALSSSTGANYRIQWKSSQRGHFRADSTTYQPKVDSAGVYTLIITDARNGCKDSLKRTVIGEFDVPKAQAYASDSLDCYHPTVNISARGTSLGVGLTYQWIANPGRIVSGDSTLNAVVDEPGRYIFIATNEKTKCSAVDTVDVFKNNKRPQNITFSVNKPTCYGEQNGSLLISTVNGGTPPYLYSLDGKVFTPRKTFSNLIAGAYKLYVQDASGCVADSAFNIVQDRQIGVSLGLDTILKLGDSILLQVGVNIPNVKRVVWSSYSDSTCRRDSACLQQWVKPVRETSYKVVVTDVNGCQADGVINVKIDKNRPIFIPDAFSPNNDGTNDIFMVHGSKVVKIIKRFQVFDRWGEMVSSFINFKADDPNNGWDGKFRGKEMITGVYTYFIEVEYLDGQIDLIEGNVTLLR